MSQNLNLTVRPRRVRTVPDPAAPPPQVVTQPDAEPAATPKLADVLGGLDPSTLAVRPRLHSMGISALRVTKTVPAQDAEADSPKSAPSAADHVANLTDEQRESLRVTPRRYGAPGGAGPVADAGLDGIDAPPLPAGATAMQRIMHSNSRVKSAVKTALHGFRGGGIPGAVAGFISGAMDDTTDERIGQARELAMHHRQQVYDLGVQKEQAEVGHINAATANLNDRAAEAQAARDAKAATQAIQRVMQQYARLGQYHPGDTADAGAESLQQQSERLGITLAPYDVKQTAPTHFVHDGIAFTLGRDTGGQVHAIPLTDAQGNPLPVDASKVADPKTGLRPAQAAVDADRDAGRAETHRHNTVAEGQGERRIGQGGERIGIAREKQALRGQPTAANMNARLARGAELNRRLEDEKNKAAHPPYTINGQPTSDAYRHAYSERHKAAAANYRDQIKSAYGDLYEVGEDGDGWSYAKPQVQPGAGARGGGATYSEADVRKRARAAGRDENAAVEAARKAGLIP